MVVVGSLITWSGAPGILGVVEEVEGQRRVVVLFDDGERRTLTIETVEPKLQRKEVRTCSPIFDFSLPPFATHCARATTSCSRISFCVSSSPSSPDRHVDRRFGRLTASSGLGSPGTKSPQED